VGRDFPPIGTGPGAHPASCTMGTWSFPGGKVWPGRDDHSPIYSAVEEYRAIPLPTLWATTGPVTGTLYPYYSI